MKSGVEVSARRYRYTGKERDDETGLYLMGARYYACWLARWTAADPAGTVDGTNLYAYVRGSPVGLVDPSGTEGIEVLNVRLSGLRRRFQARRASGEKLGPKEYRAFNKEAAELKSQIAQKQQLAGVVAALPEAEGPALDIPTLKGKMLEIEAAKGLEVIQQQKPTGTGAGKILGGGASIGVGALALTGPVGVAGGLLAAGLIAGGATSVGLGVTQGAAKATGTLTKEGEAQLDEGALAVGLLTDPVVAPVAIAGAIAADDPQAGFIAAGTQASVAAAVFAFRPSMRLNLISKNLNRNTAVANFGLYEIRVHGQLYKVGKADLGRVTQSSGLPTRLHQQVRELRKIHGRSAVTGDVVQDLGTVTTARAKEFEAARVRAHYEETGTILEGNRKSFKP